MKTVGTTELMSAPSLIRPEDDEKINILAVDDRPEGLVALEAVLSSPQYRLVKANSGEGALRAVLQEDFALILLDVQMPGMNGFETARLIRERSRTREVPIIFLTAISKDDRYVDQGYEAGAVDYLFKPVNPEILRSKVKVFVDLHRKTEQVRRQAELLRQADRRERERQIAELERASNRRYQNLADAIPNIVFRARSAGEMIYLNRRWMEFSGMPPSDCMLSGWKKAVHPDDLGPLMDRWEEAENAGEHLEAECRIRRERDGQFQWHLIQAFQEEDSSHSGTEWLGTFTLIHDRKEAEQERQRLLENELIAKEEAQRQAERFSQLTQMVPQLVWEFLGKDSVWWNQSWRDYTGILDEVLTLEQAFSPIHPDERSRVMATWEQCRLTGEPFSAQFRLRGKDGSYRWFLSQGLPCSDSCKDRWVGICTDIQEFYDLNDMRAKFLSIASHELKTPLTSIKMTLQLQLKSLMEANKVDADMAKRLLEIGVRSSDRLANLIDDLLDYSRMESGQLDVSPVSCDLVQVVHESVSSSLSAVQSTGRLELKSELPEKLPGVFDPVRMRQVVDNLIGNAIKYTPGAGSISVSLKAEGDSAVLSVSDTGIGINPEDQRRIFRAFERAVTQQEFSGLGIGLYVSMRIIDQHNGTLSVESEKGKGSTFTVRLPVSQYNPQKEVVS